MSKLHVRRIDQLDAASLNEELFELLSAQFRKSLLHFPNIFLARVGPEFELIFKLFFNYVAYRNTNSNFGQQLFDLKYHDGATLGPASQLKLKLLSFVTVSFPWFWERVLRKFIRMHLKGEVMFTALRATEKIEFYFQTLYQFLSLINFCIFLQKSKYSSLEERLLNIRPLYTVSQEIRPVMYDAVTRELMWHGLSDFLGFILTTINIYRIKNFMKKHLPWFLKKSTLMQIDLTKCHICNEIPTYPHSFGCQHVFCYYCLASNVKADPNYFCSDCGMEANGLSSVKPYCSNFHL